MSKDILRYIRQLDQPNNWINCATVSLRAVLGDAVPSNWYEEAAYEGTFDIVHLAVVAAITFYEQRQLFSHLTAPSETMTIKEYLRETRAYDRSHPCSSYRGTFISTQVEIGEDPENHVFAVTGFHKGGKVTFVDTASVVNPKYPYVRKSRKEFDSHAQTLLLGEYPAVSIFTEPLDSPDLASRYTDKEIRSIIKGWYDTAESFVWLATKGQYLD